MSAPDRDRIAVPATNDTHILELTLPMIDEATGERRTAVVTIAKSVLWRTASGHVVRGVTVTWKGAAHTRSSRWA